MSEAKFTKGEWRLIKSDDAFDDGELVVSMASHNEDQSSFYCKHKILIAGTSNGDKEAVANAHLIAAAPEMYEMLESLREDYGLLTKVGKDIDKLLTKARGEKC